MTTMLSNYPTINNNNNKNTFSLNIINSSSLSANNNQYDLEDIAEEEFVDHLNTRLPKHIRACLNEDGRVFYLNTRTKTSSWLPPMTLWDEYCSKSCDPCLPYGWEVAYDADDKPYFINHLNSTTTYEDPRKISVIESESQPVPRTVTLFRDPELGFGFVAGSEKPVIVRFVKEDGPSEGKLMAGDQILKVNGVDMADAPREEIIRRVKCCETSVTLTVCQPSTNPTNRRSVLVTAAKKARLKLAHHPRVRFAERIALDGNPFFSRSPCDSPTPVIHNVLKVYLENNQTKTFKYDTTTTVRHVLDSLIMKLSIKRPEYYTLCTEHIKSHGISKLTILSLEDTLYKIASRPGIHNLRCVLRMSFVTLDLHGLLATDPVSFDYLFAQCCNDYVQERYSNQLNYDSTLTLSSLHLIQHALANGLIGRQGKIDLKKIDKTYGLGLFLPMSTIESMKRKDLYKLLAHFIKVTQTNLGKGYTQVQCKLSYLDIISALPGFGAKNFPLNSKDSSCGAAILISPKFGISQLNRGILRQSAPITLAQFDEVTGVHVTRDEELGFRVEVSLKESPDQPGIPKLNFIFDELDVEEFVMCLRGYHRLFKMGSEENYKEISVLWEVGDSWWTDSAPVYHDDHWVEITFWNYPPDNDRNVKRLANFSNGPPPYDSSYVALDGIKRPRISSKELSRDELTVRRSSNDKRDSFSGMSTTSSASDETSGFRSRDGSISNSRSKEPDEEEIEELESPKLKAADSLELLHQISETNEQDNANNSSIIASQLTRECGESSALTSPEQQSVLGIPKKSFKSKANLKVSIPTQGMRSRSGSSFGLSTPDVIPNLLEPDNELMNALKKLRSGSRDEFELPSADTTIYLGSDMIDLTSIPPPPATPDTALILERTKHPLLMIREPPTPFREVASAASKINPFFTAFGPSTTMSMVDESSECHGSPNHETGNSSPISPPVCRDNESQTEDGYISREEEEFSDYSDTDFPFSHRPRLSLEEYEAETLQKIEQVSKGVKKMYLLEMDENRECYWES